MGNTYVGKSSLAEVYAKDRFKQEYRSTEAPAFFTRIVEVDERKVKLQIWDTASMEKFRKAACGYYKAARGIVVVFDVTSKTSFKGIEGWVSHIQE